MSVASTAAGDDRSSTSKDDVGIFSWRTDRFADPRPPKLQVQTRAQGVQTDYQFAMDMFQGPQSSRSQHAAGQHLTAETGSLWKPYGGQLSVDEGSSGSVGVFSLPTVLGGGGGAAGATGNPAGPLVGAKGHQRHPLNASSLISAVTHDDSSSMLDGGSSVASSVHGGGGLAGDPLFEQSFHTVNGPVHGRKPLNRSSSHQTKNRKLKFPEKSSGTHQPQQYYGSGGGGGGGGLVLDDWNDGFYLDRSAKGLYGGAVSKALAVPGFGHDDSSTASFMDLSVSGKRFHDQHSTAPHHHGGLPKIT